MTSIVRFEHRGKRYILARRGAKHWRWHLPRYSVFVSVQRRYREP